MIVIYEKPGRLANSLWLYAHFIAFSEENDIPVCFPALADYGRYFKSTANSLMYNYPTKRSTFPFSFLRNAFLKLIPFFVKVCQKLGLKFNHLGFMFLKNGQEINLEEPAYLPTLSKRFVLLKGWLYRADNLIVKHKEKIVSYFEPIVAHEKNVNELIGNCRKKCDFLVGVHIRREDYRTAFDGIYYYDIKDYKMKMDEIQLLFKDRNIGFLICSNEKIDSSEFSGLKIFMGNDHIIEDMYSFAKCDLIIGPPSTYSMWASFYGNVPLYQVKEINRKVLLEDFTIIIN